MVATISIANQKGGTAKTTTAANLSACLARHGKRVLAIDLDSQANLTSHFGLVPFDIEKTVYDLIMDPEKSVADLALPIRKNLDLVPANLNLASLDIELAGAVNRDQRLRRKLRQSRQDYDYVLIDCPPALSFATLNAFTASDVLLICIQTQMFSFAAVERLPALAESLGRVERLVSKPGASVDEISEVVEDRDKDGLDENGTPYMNRSTTYLIKRADGKELPVDANVLKKPMTFARKLYQVTRPHDIPWTLYQG